MHVYKQNIIDTIKRWFSKEEFFTILFVPHTPSKNTRAAKFRRWYLTIFVIFNLIAFGIICAFTISYSSLNMKLKNKRIEYQSLKSIEENQEQELSKYKDNENEIKRRIQSLIDLDKNLRSIINTKEAKLQSLTKGSIVASRSLETSNNTYGQLPAGEFESLDEMYSTIDSLESQINIDICVFNDATAKVENAIKTQNAIKEANAIKAENAIKVLNSIPSLMPTYGIITSFFGYREDPTGGGSEYHKGIDIASRKGTPIKASASGIVTKAGWDTGGYGYLVKINHQNGYESLYGHNSKIIVHVGQHVERGKVIAYMGATGDATGNHCHFEVLLNGRNINPLSVKSKTSNK